MIIHNLGLIEYKRAREKMQHIHTQAVIDGKNHLILCSHPNIFTVGKDDKTIYSVDFIKTDRGGAITCHSIGQNIYYFCFQAKNPPLFYKRVIKAFKEFFKEYLPNVYYSKENPGFYIDNRKIASLGFRYSKGVSLHGVALNVDVDLAFHSQVPPCNLKGIIPTSLHNEGVNISQEEANKRVVKLIQRSFNDYI